jgi:outer membrane receptor protein involved in Fe transport
VFKIHRLFQVVFAISFLFFGEFAFSQSTGSIGGTVTDAAGSTVPNANVSVKNQATGEEHSTRSDISGIYLVPSLPVGTYRIEVRSPGMQTMIASGVELSVSSAVRQDFALKLGTVSETIEVTGGASVIESSTSSLGSVVNQHTVQEIPLNGRHFIDLALLTPGTVTPPANGFLTAPLRGQGSFAYNSAGAREDSFNPMVNGINLSDPNQNQITFQPTINTVDEIKIDNSTFSAEYGRNSGSVMNIATRAGENAWHGEAYEYLRNDYLDARNWSNPTFVTVAGTQVSNLESQFIRNQFGGDGGGGIIKNRLFAFLSYEGLRQRQAVPLSATVLTAAQRALAAGGSPAIQALLPLIPLANSGTSSFAGSASAPVNIEQGTANISYLLNSNNRLNFYYAIQRDQRNEPPSTDGNSFPGGGDQRNGHRQLLTFNEDWTISPSLTNEFRAGANRIHIVFSADNTGAAPAFGINSGVTAAIGIPQISVSGAFTFGGISGFPQGRGDDVGTFSDTLSWVHGNHIVKFGGEFRRQNSDNFSYTPGTFGFANITAFLNDQSNSFSVTNSNRSNRTYGNSIGAFVTDTWKVLPTFSVTLGVRYDWYGTPTEAENRYVVFDPTTDSLVHVGQSGGGPSTAYQQSAKNFEPRVGVVWDPFKTGKTVVRSAYAIMTDQPTLGLITGLAGNPPYAFPISYTPPAGSFVTLENAFPLAAGSVSPVSIAHNYHDAYFSEWNFNIEQQLGKDYGVTVSYVGSKGSDLNIERNYNQFVNGVRPYPTLSANSPIDPGKPLTNILVYESDGNSSYQALWIAAKKRFSKGLQFDTYYSRSKSIDDNSRNVQGLTIQDSNNIRGDRGLSDFDARNRFVISGVYALPFEGNKFVHGWQLSLIETLQSGNPQNFHLSNTSFAGAAVLRPNVTGSIVTGYEPSSNGAATAIGYIDNPTVFVNQGTTAGTVLGFGNLGRNVVIGPGFSNLDIAIVRNIKVRERINFQIRADAYDIFNHPNFGNPVTTVGSATLGVITSGSRAPAGDFGSSRQIQLALKLQF